MLDTNCMNLGQIAHKLWLLFLFYPIYHFWGLKLIQMIFNGFCKCQDICLDTNFMNLR